MEDDLTGRRLETLEHSIRSLEHQHSSTLHRLRWWRRLAGTRALLTVFSLPLSLGAGPADRKSDDRKGGNSQHHKPKDDQEALRGLLERFRAIERKLEHVTSEVGPEGFPELVLTGANLRIVNGLGKTSCGAEDAPIPDCPNGLGNLIVGYNEGRVAFPGNPPRTDNIRTGSHNVVVGTGQNYSSFGGLVVGFQNSISGNFASVSGGAENLATGNFSSVSGGHLNLASGAASSVSGGFGNRAQGENASISGGQDNGASGKGASVSGGFENSAFGHLASVSGGNENQASGALSSISGGFSNTASGTAASVSGGQEHRASGTNASISGGFQRRAEGEFDWVAGGLFQDQ